MEVSPGTETYLDYTNHGFDITCDLTELGKKFSERPIDQTAYDTQLTQLAERSLSYLAEGLERFPTDFALDIEAESLARSLKAKERRTDFAVRFNELLYASVSNPLHPIDAISDTKRLQRAIDLTVIADRLNAHNFYEQPNRTRELGDAVVGRVVLTMLSFNMDPRSLRIPIRN